MALGLCCQWLVVKNGKPKNLLVSRSLQLGRFQSGKYSSDKIRQTYVDNLKNLFDVMPDIIASGIRSLRISSAMFPLFDKVDRELFDNDDTRKLMRKVGDLAQLHELRVTTHPGQFTVLSSDSADTVDNAITEVEHHAWVFDCMGLDPTPYYSINVHGGKSDRNDQLIAAINRLSPSARSRLTLENCEFAYSVQDLLPVSRSTGVPICFDSHHHRFNTADLTGEQALDLAASTWPDGVKPMTHLSNSKPDLPKTAPNTKLRQHSDYIRYVPDYQLAAHNAGRIDIEVEAKLKNLAIFKAVTDVGLCLT